MIKITGIREAVAMIMSAANDHPKKLKQQTAISSRRIEKYAKEMCPVEFGELRRSIFTEIDDNGYRGTITANADYAPFVEFGTGSKVNIPQGFEEMATEFIGHFKRERNKTADPFLIPSFLIELPKYKEKCQKIIQQ